MVKITNTGDSKGWQPYIREVSFLGKKPSAVKASPNESAPLKGISYDNCDCIGCRKAFIRCRYKTTLFDLCDCRWALCYQWQYAERSEKLWRSLSAKQVSINLRFAPENEHTYYCSKCKASLFSAENTKCEWMHLRIKYCMPLLLTVRLDRLPI